MGKNPGAKACSHAQHVCILFPASGCSQGGAGSHSPPEPLATAAYRPPETNLPEPRSLTEGTDIVPWLSEHSEGGVSTWGYGTPPTGPVVARPSLLSCPARSILLHCLRNSMSPTSPTFACQSALLRTAPFSCRRGDIAPVQACFRFSVISQSASTAALGSRRQAPPGQEGRTWTG